MAMFDNKGLGNIIRGGCRRLRSLQVSAIFASASHRGPTNETGPAKSFVKIHWIIELKRAKKNKNKKDMCGLHSSGCTSTVTISRVCGGKV